MIHSTPGARSYGVYRSTPRFVTPRGYGGRYLGSAAGVTQRGFRQGARRATAGGLYQTRSRQIGQGPRRLGPGTRQIGQRTVSGRGQLARQAGDRRNWVTGSVQGAKRASVLRNSTFARSSSRNGRNFAHSKYEGRFSGQKWKDHQHHGWHWRHDHPIYVIGWFGPLFWPYAYWDFIDYTFWPYAYDAFWPYAYDDLYVGVFGPYAYEGPGYACVYRKLDSAILVVKAAENGL